MVRALVGPRIRERRRAKKLSQAALAKEVGISASYLNLIEHNRRGIAGKTLNAIARRLDMRPEELSDDADAGLVNQLTEAAGAAPDASAEMDRVTEFLARFPGWARALASHHTTNETQTRHLEMLSDRLSHDPYLSEAMHLMLTSVTAVSSTAGILVDGGPMSDEQRARFTTNLYAESQRLTETARDLVAYFDKPADDQPDSADAAEAFWSGRAHFVEELERGGDLDEIDDDIEPSLTDYARMAQLIPASEIMRIGPTVSWDPLALAGALDKTLPQIFRRLAHLPSSAPSFGLIECDAAGGVLFRKELPGFPLPRNAGACPLWPLYRALSRIGEPIRATLLTPQGDAYYAWAIASADPPSIYGVPSAARASMLFSSSVQSFGDTTAPQLEIGAHCTVCARQACNSRRAPFLLK